MGSRDPLAFDEKSDEFVDRVNQFFEEVVFGFIFQDIDKCIAARANFVVALALSVYTEFMGGLYTGLLGQRGKERWRFEAFFRKLGPHYSRLLSASSGSVDIYSTIRSGLVHSYFIGGTATIAMYKGTERCGIIVQASRIYFIAEKYFEDFKRAACDYHNRLVVNRDKDLLRNFRLAVGDRRFFQEATN